MLSFDYSTKRISSVLLLFLLLVTPLSGVFANDLIIGGSAGHYQSSIGKTFYAIPTDGRKLEDFVFTDTNFHYKHYADPAKDYIFTGAKISTKMNWFVDYFNYPEDDIGSIFKNQFSPILIIVDPSKWEPDEDALFGIPVFDYRGIRKEYVYLDMKIDENQNYCVYLWHYDSIGSGEKHEYKLENTCHMKFLDREPFFLFMNFYYRLLEYPNTEFYDDKIGQSDVQNEILMFRYTTDYKTTYNDQEVVSFYPSVSKSIRLKNLLYYYPYDFTYFYQAYDSEIQGYRNFYNSFGIQDFKKFKTSQMYRTYSYNFNQYFFQKHQENECDGPQQKQCRILFPGKSDNFLDSFVHTFATQYFGSPTYTPEHTYVGTGAIFNTGDIDFSACSGLDIGCYLGKIGNIFAKGFGGIFSAFSGIGKALASPFIGLFDGIKGIFVWLWEMVTSFLNPIVKPIYDFFKGIFNFFMINIEDLKHISFSGTMQTCKDFENIEQEKVTIAQGLTNIISLAIPFAPPNNTEACTFDGRKIIDYKDNTKFLDTIFVIVAFMSVIFTFISGNTKHA